MIKKPKGRKYFVVVFRVNGKTIQKRTRAVTRKDARKAEVDLKSELSRGNWSVLKNSRPAPAPLTLAGLLEKHFLPHVGATITKPATVRYYTQAVASLIEMPFARLPIAQITGQHAGQYAARHSAFSPSTINRGLRTLRRALNLAEQWGNLERAPKIALAKGERQRDRVLNDREVAAYLPACPQPWQAIATILLATGMRPGEAFALQWEHVTLDAVPPMLRIHEGKTKAAKRELPMLPAVQAVIRNRWIEQGQPAAGWVFPAPSASGHIEQGTAKKQHATALRVSGVTSFVPYLMRHTALTNLAAAGADAFTLGKIAGHASIVITQRYCHPQREAVERAFDAFAQHQAPAATVALSLPPTPAEAVPPVESGMRKIGKRPRASRTKADHAL